MNLDERINEVIAQLHAGQNPRQVLMDFAVSVRSSDGECVSVRTVHTCKNCGQIDVRCPKCAAIQVAQEKVLPGLLARFQSFGQDDDFEDDE